MSLIVLLALAGGALVFFRGTPLALSGVEVASDVCDASLATGTTVRSRWSGDALHLAIAQVENCGLGLESVAVQRVGGHLFVRTGYRAPEGPQPACYCTHRTTLQVRGVPVRDYRVHAYAWP
ncbi:hypothetical protein [Pseudoxanthomonas sp. 10H]|uniref:hypothetical protein n=1 Tax=Pseudoxanthomonas sp. 10H TaxID=3242729 RepID=UPI003557F0FF